MALNQTNRNWIGEELELARYLSSISLCPFYVSLPLLCLSNPFSPPPSFYLSQSASRRIIPPYLIESTFIRAFRDGQQTTAAHPSIHRHYKYGLHRSIMHQSLIRIQRIHLWLYTTFQFAHHGKLFARSIHGIASYRRCRSDQIGPLAVSHWQWYAYIR